MPSLPLLLVAALGLSGAAPDTVAPLLGPGISRQLAAYRAAQLRDVRYDLHLDVTARDSAVGRITIRFERTAPGDVILDFRGRALRAPRVNDRPAEAVVANGAHVRIPAALLRLGANELQFEFVTPIAPSGASVIRFHDSSDGADYIYTLLVPADANQLFPCFDQPDLKARVTLSLTVPHGWSAVANGSETGADSTARGRVVRFRETHPISTYLIAFAAGPWVRMTSADGGRPMTLYVRASRAHEVERDSLLLQNRRALEWLERYFGQPYPFEKYDFVLAPAFPFGGMEHPGAVFYSEERFVYREPPTLPQRLARTATIYHEVAHQWFGDFVTMRWFDDLWLKEGFATYMAAKMQAELDPAADAWKSFFLRNKPLAYGVDLTEGTTPVWQALANLDQAKSNYGPIVYNKAPAVLKQLEYLVGEAAFRRGLRDLLRTHAYGNATWRDLLGAVGAAAGRSLDEWGRQYILRPGMPVIEQALRVRDGRIARLALVQRPARQRSGRGAWPMRLQLLLLYEDAPAVRLPVELAAETTLVRAAVGRPAPALVFANAGDYGYAATLLDDRSLRWLERRIGTVQEPLLRAMLWTSLWDVVRDARLAPARFVTLAARELPGERDEQIVAAILSRVTRATNAYLGAAQRDSLLPSLEAVLLAGARDTARPYGIRKAHLDALVDVARTPATLARLGTLLDGAPLAGEPVRAPTRWAIVTALLERGAPDAEARLRAETLRDTTSDGRRRAFVAGAARQTVETKQHYFARYLGDPGLNEDWSTASLAAFNSLDAQALTLPYLVPALDTLAWIQKNRRIFFLGSWLAAFLGGQMEEEALQRVQRYLETHPALPQDLREKILQATDELERTVRIRRRYVRPAEPPESRPAG